MSRRKGETGPLHIRRTYPHRVEMTAEAARALPGHSLHQMQSLARQPLHEQRGGQQFIVYCFLDAGEADRFQAVFGGRRFRVTIDPRQPVES